MTRAAVRYASLPTEQSLPASRHLDQLSPESLLRLMSEEDARVIEAVRAQHPRIATAIRLIAARLADGGRLIFIGAGTSGRLGVIEAAECPPTFSTPPPLVQALMAGGPRAIFRSKEGAEDRAGEAAAAVRKSVKPGDVVVGVTASGVTPFVAAGLRTARARGAATVLVSCHPRARQAADVAIRLDVGPELLSGSTRLKAGTATKLVLNMLSLGAMVRLGKTYGHFMVDVRPTSRKLEARARRIVRQLTGCSAAQASNALAASGGRAKTAILMLCARIGRSRAEAALAAHGGSLRKALLALGAALPDREVS